MTGPGRPSTGTKVQVRIPADLLAKIDKHAKWCGVSRAEMVRIVLAEGFSPSSIDKG